MSGNLVILAGGLSSRMKKDTDSPSGTDHLLARDAQTKPKSMIGLGIGGRPFLDYLIYNAREAGYGNIVIVVGEKDVPIRERYGHPGQPVKGVKVSFAVQAVPSGRSTPLGTADALLCALRARSDWQGKTFTVCNSDNLYSTAVLKKLLECPHPGALIDYDRDALAFAQERIERFALVEKDADGFLVRIVEKPTRADYQRARAESGRIGVSMNIFRFTYDVIISPLREVLPDPLRKEKELPQAVGLLVKRHPRSVIAIPVAEYVPDLTSKDDISAVQKYLQDHYAGAAF